MKKLLFLVPLLLLIGAACTKEGTASSVSSALEIQEPFKDMGFVPMDKGTVDLSYTITNTGEEPVFVSQMYTSCMCTVAQLKTKEDTSPRIGMKGHGAVPPVNMDIAPGETATVNVTFDPNAHGPEGTGLIRRAIYLETNSTATPVVELQFQAEVVRTTAEIPQPQTSLLKTSETEYDFGVVKQSGGIVTHDFKITYNGVLPRTVVGTPTSCSCTTASVDTTTLETGDEAIISVAFDPNLHEEPEGKFFKTITLLTEPPLEEPLELKIFAEIDLDLGKEAYTLQDHED